VFSRSNGKLATENDTLTSCGQYKVVHELAFDRVISSGMLTLVSEAAFLALHQFGITLQRKHSFYGQFAWHRDQFKCALYVAMHAF